MGLLQVPGAARLGIAQPGHHGHQVGQGSFGGAQVPLGTIPRGQDPLGLAWGVHGWGDCGGSHPVISTQAPQNGCGCNLMGVGPFALAAATPVRPDGAAAG